MERIIVNLSGSVRNATLHNRAYLVAPLTLIVPGVLNGSKGNLYYPEEEVTANPDIWNGMPIVIYHPILNGIHISARSPEVFDTQWVGTILNAKARKSKLVAEGWFDIEATQRVDARVLESLQSGTPIELSTGLFTNNIPAEEGAVFNSPSGPRPYDYVARDYRPDHLAILPDQIGACSLKDGCGVLVNCSCDSSEWKVINPFADDPENSKVWTPMTINSSAGSAGIADSVDGLLSNVKQLQIASDELVVNNFKAVANIDKTMSFEEVESAVREAFRTAHPYKPSASMSYEDECWIVSIFDNSFIYREGGELYRQSYSMDKNSVVTLGTDAVQVKKQTKYVPVATANRGFDMKLSDTERQQIIVDLTTNCECWKGKGDREVLVTFNDEKLIQLKDHAVREQQMIAVANAAVKGVPDGTGNVFRVNPQTGGWEKGTVNASTNPANPSPKPVPNPTSDPQRDDDQRRGQDEPSNRRDDPPPRQPKTFEDYINMAPAHLRSQVENTLRVAQEVEQREKNGLITHLLVNVAENEKQAQFERLQRRSVDDLRSDLLLIPKPPKIEDLSRVDNDNRRAFTVFSGEEDMLHVPTINWQKVDTGVETPAQVGTPTSSNSSHKQQMSDDEYLRTLPPHLRTVVQNAVVIEGQERRKLITELTSNISLDEEQERQLIHSLNSKPIHELKLLLSLKPRTQKQSNYFGGGAPTPTTTNVRNDVNEDILMPPQMNWKDIKQAN